MGNENPRARAPGLHLEQQKKRAEELLRAALDDEVAAIETALELWPETRGELHVAAALADEAAVAERLGAGASLGPLPHSLGMSALAVLCHARFGRANVETRAARGRIAEALLAAGADARECVETWETPGGKLSVLAAAARHTASASLLCVLLDAGAELEPPGSTAGPPAPPLVSAALGGNLECVELLLSRGAPAWQAREALEVTIERDDREMARALLSHGALPDEAGRWAGHGGGSLHAALWLGRDDAFLELLLAGGATVNARDRDGLSALQVAVRLGRDGAADLFMRHGASRDEVAALDELLGACVGGPAERVRARLVAEPGLVVPASEAAMVCWAARHGRHDALERLLSLGLDANAVDDDGQTALHLAVLQGDARSVALLVKTGASVQAPNYDEASPLDLARLERDAERRSALLEGLRGSEGLDADENTADDLLEQREAERGRLGKVFEAAVALMVRGDLDALRALLDREPALARARSPRFHRATLLHYLSSNGTEVVVTPPNAGEIARLLLERGAEVDASCRMYGGGPAQTALGLVVTSHFPEEAGTMGELVSVLVAAGARASGRDAKSGALEGAIAFGRASAIEAFVACGVTPHDLASAAAMGDIGALEAELLADSVERLAASGRLARAVENAAVFGRLAVLERLLPCQPDLDTRGEMGATALHRAALANRAESVRWLLAHGADPALRDAVHQGTPADWARHAGAEAALGVLTEPGHRNS